MRNAWVHLAELDRDKDGAISRDEIPRQFQMAAVASGDVKLSAEGFGLRLLSARNRNDCCILQMRGEECAGYSGSTEDAYLEQGLNSIGLWFKVWVLVSRPGGLLNMLFSIF